MFELPPRWKQGVGHTFRVPIRSTCEGPFNGLLRQRVRRSLAAIPKRLAPLGLGAFR